MLPLAVLSLAIVADRITASTPTAFLAVDGTSALFGHDLFLAAKPPAPIRRRPTRGGGVKLTAIGNDPDRATSMDENIFNDHARVDILKCDSDLIAQSWRR